MNIVLAVDLGGTNLRVAAIDRTGSVYHRLKFETPKGECADDFAASMVKVINKCLQAVKNSANAVEITAVAVAVPGTVNPATEAVSNAPNIPLLQDFQLGKNLSERLGVPVLLENDANAAAVGENWLGASKGSQNSICVTLGTGVGGGIIIDGKILRGIDGTAGEIGHICVEPFGVLCGCGSFGCVEQYSSAQALVRLMHQLASKYSESTLKNKPNSTALDIFNAGEQGDELALEIFRQQGFYLGIALADLINVLNPEVIVIGGGGAAGGSLFMPYMREQIDARAYRQPAERVKILTAEKGDDAGILGVAKLAFDNLPGTKIVGK